MTYSGHRNEGGHWAKDKAEGKAMFTRKQVDTRKGGLTLDEKAEVYS